MGPSRGMLASSPIGRAILRQHAQAWRGGGPDAALAPGLIIARRENLRGLPALAVRGLLSTLTAEWLEMPPLVDHRLFNSTIQQNDSSHRARGILG